MPFPHHDRAWVETARFVRDRLKPGEMVIAPDEFVDELPTVHSYAATFSPVGAEHPWVVVHKGMLERLDGGFLRTIDAERHAVFANDVFVVFAQEGRLGRIELNSPHLLAFRERLRTLPSTPLPRLQHAGRLQPRPDIAKLTVEEIRQEMNRRYSSTANDAFGGYEHDHLWDKVRYEEVNRVFGRLIGSVHGSRVLQVGCGLGRATPMLCDCAEYLGTDLSDVAIERAQKMHGGPAHLRF